MGKTLAQIESYVKSKVGENDHQKVYPALLRADINFAVLKVQQDLIAIGARFMDKIVYNAGNIFNAPSDLLAIPNAIEAIFASTGEKASDTGVTFGDPGEYMQIYAVNPGTEWNGWEITLEDTGALGTPVFDFGAQTVTLSINGGTSTGTQIINALNNDTLFAEYFLATVDNGSAVSAEQNYTFSLSGGTGSGWVICRDLSTKQFGTVKGNFYQEPDDDAPCFLRHGGLTGNQRIKLLPETVKYSLTYCYYRLPEMTASTDETGIPSEYEELVLLYSVARTYETLRMMEDSAERRLEYQAKREEYEALYDKKMRLDTLEDRRKQSSDQLS